MRQALHIFGKDVRHLRWEILVLLLLDGLAAMSGGATAAVGVAAVFVVVRLVHAEAIPGDRQFWLTRPYRPGSLLGAKLLFLAVVVCVPFGIAEAGLAVRMGFPLAQEIPALLWTQFLLFFVVGLPLMAVASVTAGLQRFAVAVLVPGTIAFLGSGLSGNWPRVFPPIPAGVEWIREVPLAVILVSTAAVILWWQYRDRRTLFSCLFGAVVFNLAMAGYLLMPAWVPLTVQMRFSKRPEMAARVQASLDLKLRRERTERTDVPLPVALTGVPDGVEARSDLVDVTFAWPGQTWRPIPRPSSITARAVDGRSVIDAVVVVNRDLYSARRDVPVTVRGVVYLTLFGETERRPVRWQKSPVNVQDGLQVFSGAIMAADYTICRALLRWPGVLVYAEGPGGLSNVNNSFSYSPFPAELSENPVEVHFTERIHAEAGAIVTKRPLVHFRREFELGGIRLRDFETPVAPRPF